MGESTDLDRKIKILKMGEANFAPTGGG